jgi:hypothetical protein
MKTVQFHAVSETSGNLGSYTLTCPGCSVPVALKVHKRLTIHASPHGIDTLLVWICSCPSASCRTSVIVISDMQLNYIHSFPPSGLPLDLSNVPKPIIDALTEAHTCFTNQCFTAAAIMVRKSLEALCDERGAGGKNLVERISNLGTAVILPPQLLEGLDHIRLLGNDAAHLDLKTFASIGPDEVQFAFTFTEKVLEAIYQYEDLLQQFKALTITPPPPSTTSPGPISN